MASSVIPKDNGLFGNFTLIGSQKISDGSRLTFTESASHFKFIMFVISYYGSGAPAYGSLLIPDSILETLAEHISFAAANTIREPLNKYVMIRTGPQAANYVDFETDVDTNRYLVAFGIR